MATNYRSVNVKCPFYLSEAVEKKSIRCEGATEGSAITVRFVKDEYYEVHRQTYCCSVYTSCPYYKLIKNNKYKSPETV